MVSRMTNSFKRFASSMKTRTKPQKLCGLFKDETLENQLKRRNKENKEQWIVHQRWLKEKH